MAKYTVSENGKPVLTMESTDTGLVKLYAPENLVYVTPDTADEARTLLARVIAEARGDKP